MADFLVITKLAELETVIADGIGESLTMDFKAAPSLTRDSANVLELCKDVSAFANSAGGQIVYGVAEDKKAKTFNIDGGVTDPKITREWIDQILGSKIQPRIPFARIGEIELGGEGRAFVITVPQTQTGPHQAPDFKYYRRFDLQSVPMHDYEIRDVMRRSTTPAPFAMLSFGGGTGKHVITANNTNTGTEPFHLRTTLSNKNSQPTYHAVIDVGVDKDVRLSHNSGWQWLGVQNDSDGLSMQWFRWTLGSPPALPIFKEHNTELPQIAFKIPDGIPGLEYWDITVRMSAPGYTNEEHWAISRKGSTLVMHPPGTPMTDRKSQV